MSLVVYRNQIADLSLAQAPAGFRRGPAQGHWLDPDKPMKTQQTLCGATPSPTTDRRHA